jgi:SAM-dependent methyltransferase
MHDSSRFDDYCDWKEWSAESFGVCPGEKAAYFDAELRGTPLPMHAPLRVLEIGFGNGEFARWAHTKGYRYTGTEAIPELVARGRAAGFDVHDADWRRLFASIEPGSLDLVVAFDVIEHLDLVEAEALLRTVCTALRPGGCLLGRTPSGDSPFGRVAQHSDLTHRLTLGSRAIRQLAARHGFEVHDIRPPRVPVTGLGLRRAVRRLLVLGTQRVIGSVINLAFHHGTPTVMTSNMVFVLRRPGARPGGASA